jgi:hypothetical protein
MKQNYIRINYITKKINYLFFLFILLLIFIVIHYISKNIKETFDNNKNIILLGDSILKNNIYVKQGQSVEELLLKTFKNIYNLAKDNSKIRDIYYQINKINNNLNNENTYIFLSVGGNDILEKYLYDNNNITNYYFLYEIFNNYKKLIRKLKTKMDKSKIVLINIYKIKCKEYEKFLNLIDKWNNLLYNFSKTNKDIYKLISLSFINDEDDFTQCIEPSHKGGIKLTEEMKKTII